MKSHEFDADSRLIKLCDQGDFIQKGYQCYFAGGDSVQPRGGDEHPACDQVT